MAHGPIVLAHGGAGSSAKHADGTDAAAERALALLAEGAPALEAAIAAVVVLEDDERFNAGAGSNLRLDGETVEMDAACMAGDGRFGGVACIRDVKNPVLAARLVMDTDHVLLAGEGASAFARLHGLEPAAPVGERARARHAKVRAFLAGEAKQAPYGTWTREQVRAHWNFDEPFPSDTVGAVVFDGREHAAALSTGGIPTALLGRVGDTPLPGCGLFAGPEGAVACTGHGESIARRVLAHQVYAWLAQGTPPEDTVAQALSLFPDETDVGLLVVGDDGAAGGANRDMAWTIRRA